MSQLSYSNNWEADNYFVDGVAVGSLSKVSIQGQEFLVTAKRVSVPYSDMGHTYTASSTHYFIPMKIFGETRLFDLNTFESIIAKGDVIALEWDPL